MAQNIYDRPDFFEGYSRLPRSRLGLEGAPEWPAIRAMLPPLRGRRVVDLGCGFGWFARWAAAQGAAQVLGVDLSTKMLARARSGTADPAITFLQADLERLELPEAGFDLAYSSLALHYIEDFGRLVRMVHRALVPGAGFVFTIEHPIYMASRQPGWMVREGGGRSWAVDHYAVEGERRTDWLAKGVAKQHRTLGTTLTTLIRAGFTLREVQEWHPTPAQLAAQPALAEEMDRPMLLLVAATR
ncbi:class I SAM-dependent methyltransferase [Siccirubricoccus sp. KC 17139]|uniref:Class I SAM-dependent methyltransferase n=1 Tax=Siccirubricoccus soli TaxID=2899147 RepID=A0ABT1D156_9PROT|nr:class I SAM-dependent methyltransferase [Siccirubricoccus soli]MCO6415644.1 class I SAM-dependent methyltransferase [Siccirubricoccus soli]MCP2681776.1 class I SAM-dependent methyltransferase [Siccirubricoccus soli]